MKDCQNIRRQLSAYVDGELTPAQRTEVDAHLASCPDCQQEVAELKMLAAGLAALPQLRPAPRFLAEVRRKIARGDSPEPPAWQDHLFRPFWLKVPLELAAIIAIVGYVMRLEEPMPVERGASIEMAKKENLPNEREALETAMKAEPAAKFEPAAAAPSPTPTASVGAGQESPTAGRAESPEAQITADNQPVPSGAASASGAQLFYVPSKDEKAAGLATDNLKLQDRRRPVTLDKSFGGLAMAGTSSAAANSVSLAAFGIEPSKLGGVVMVNNKKLADVRSRAGLLAAKCNGKVFPGPQSKDATGQVFFVEVPREYAAAFRLELLQEPPLPGLTNNANIHGVFGSATGTVATATSAVHAVGSVLVGRQETNEGFDTYSRLDLVRETKAMEPPTVVLEIVVLPPHSLAPTNAMPVPATPAY
jgi:anti-sigma factor RsiW